MSWNIATGHFICDPSSSINSDFCCSFSLVYRILIVYKPKSEFNAVLPDNVLQRLSIDSSFATSKTPPAN